MKDVQLLKDAGLGFGGISLSQLASQLDKILGAIVLVLTIVLLVYRIRNERQRLKNGDRDED